MSSDDSQNNSARDYDDQYDDEVISGSGGSSPGHSDDVEVVDARPVGGRPAKARPTAPLLSTTSKAPPKKKEKVHKGEDRHTTDQPPLGSHPSGSFAAPDQTKSTGKRPMEVAEADPPTDVHAVDPKRAQLTGDKPGLADALAHGAFSLPEMFNMLFHMIPPPADFVNEKADYVTGQVAHHISQVASGAAELFVRAIVDVSHRDQEIRELKEKVGHLEAHIDSLNRYPSSDQFFRDAAALYPSRLANLPTLVKSFCSSEDDVAPLLQALHQDLVGLQALHRVTAWGYHRGKYVMQESIHQALADVAAAREKTRTAVREKTRTAVRAVQSLPPAARQHAVASLAAAVSPPARRRQPVPPALASVFRPSSSPASARPQVRWVTLILGSWYVMDHSQGQSSPVDLTNDNDDEITQPSQLERQVKKRRLTSEVWNHFLRIPKTASSDKETARCKYCNKEYTIGSHQYGTSTLSRHLSTCKQKPKYEDVGNMLIDYEGKLRAKKIDHNRLLEFCYKKLDESTYQEKLDIVKNKLYMLFEAYKATSLTATTSSTASTSRCENVVAMEASDDFDDEFLDYCVQDNMQNGKSALDVYLDEPQMDMKSYASLDILNFWKDNKHRFGELSLMACDVLSIPITTVASESAFSIGGRVLNKYRNSLLPSNVQALICTRNWLSGFELDDKGDDGDVEDLPVRVPTESSEA
nr:zinc finger BED domain-containing protein DAYSLEEPER-like [Ipomoea trifida]